MKETPNNYMDRLRRDGHDERMVVVDDPARLDWALDVFFNLHRRQATTQFGRPHADYFARPVYCAFLRTIARRLLAREAIWPCLLYVDRESVAAHICLCTADASTLIIVDSTPHGRTRG